MKEKNRENIIASLSTVIDPELGINIIDMGFIYRVEIINEKIEIDYTLTSMGCPLADVIEKDIKKIIKKDFNSEVVLKLVWEPTWKLDFLSESARVELGYPI